MLRLTAIVFGAILLLIGIMGFIPVFTEPVAGSDHKLLLGIFEVNAVHNIIHLLTGAVGLLAAISTMFARRYFQVFGIVYGLVFVVGLIQGHTVLGLFSVNSADHVLHAIITGLALYMGFFYRGDAAAKKSAVVR